MKMHMMAIRVENLQQKINNPNWENEKVKIMLFQKYCPCPQILHMIVDYKNNLEKSGPGHPKRRRMEHLTLFSSIADGTKIVFLFFQVYRQGKEHQVVHWGQY